MATLGLDSRPLKAGLNQSVADANVAGNKISSALNPGEGKIAGLRHVVQIFRELAAGDIPAASRSAAMLANHFGKLGFLLNPVTGSIVGLGAGLFAAYKLAGELTERLSGLKFPDMHPEYIAKHLQSINAAAEAQKEINKEVEHSIDLYNSAGKAAERQAKASEEHFEHLKKMQELAKERELADASTAAQKDAVQKKYSDLALKLDAEERAAKAKGKNDEANALMRESAQKKAEGDKIVVNSKEHDQQVLAQRKKMADEAEKYLEDLQKSKGGAKDKLVRGYNAAANSGVSNKNLDAAERANKDEARRRISSYREYVDQSADYEEKRRRKSELYKEAGRSASEAASAALEAKDLKATEGQKAKDLQEEAAAKLAAQEEKDIKHSGGGMEMARNNAQRIGAYGAESPREAQMLDSARRSEGHLQKIEGHLEQLAGKGGAPNRGVSF